MKLRFKILTILLTCTVWANAQQIPLPKNLEQGYPRIFTTETEKENLELTIQQEDWAKEVLSGIHSRIDEHVNRHVNDPEWMVSRLQMYWKTKASNVYIEGINYSHADGEAPVPTVLAPWLRPVVVGPVELHARPERHGWPGHRASRCAGHPLWSGDAWPSRRRARRPPCAGRPTP